MESSVETLHTRYFNALARAFPGMLHLHYGLAEEHDTTPWGLPRRLRAGPERLTERLIALLDPATLPPDAEGLDLGCGLGGTCVALARRGLRMTGVNLTEAQVALARPRVAAAGVADRVRVLCADARALPLPEASVDVVTVVECAFHIPDKHRLFAEIGRVLRPGGRLVLADQERPAGAMEVMGMFFFPEEGAYTRLAAEVGLHPAGFEDLSAPVAAWMRDYALTAALPFVLAMCASQLLALRPQTAWTLWTGNRHFRAQVAAELRRRGLHLPPGLNPLRALRLHTREELRTRQSLYALWRFDAPGGIPPRAPNS